MEKNDDIDLEIDEFNLEELIILGDDKKIPITISFPRNDGSKVKAKALVKQLTLKELETLNVRPNDTYGVNLAVLEEALFKSNGENFTEEEITKLPLGVVNAIGAKILELSGVDFSNNMIRDFSI